MVLCFIRFWGLLNFLILKCSLRRVQIDVEDLSAVEQFKLVLGVDELTSYVLPTTSQVTPLAHLVFKLCIANLCPRIGNRSNFTYQDLVVVAMILAGKPFDMADLVLKTMLNVVSKAKSGLPYGCLLIKVFEHYKIKFEESDKQLVTEFFDERSLAQSNLKVLDDGSLVYVESTPSQGINVQVEDVGSGLGMQQLNVKVEQLNDKFEQLNGKVDKLSAKVEEIMADQCIMKGWVAKILQIAERTCGFQLQVKYG